MLVGFEWDPAKAKSNLQKHSVSFDEACTVFDDPLSLTISDPDHSFEEQRFITIGHSNRGNLLLVCHCDTAQNIRIFSARPPDRRERRQYASAEE